MADEERNEMVVTPWEVRGKVDYERLIREFGTQPLTDELLKRIAKYTGELHLQLRRRLFFSHRDLDTVLDLYDKGIKFVLYTGRGPSGPVHIGHLVPWIFTRHLQEKFDTRLYFQMTDDEKFLVDDELELEDTKRFAYENALDLIALGFEPGPLFGEIIRSAEEKHVEGFEREQILALIAQHKDKPLQEIIEILKTLKNSPK